MINTEQIEKVLEFERSWWTHAGRKPDAIREAFGLDEAQYYRQLEEILGLDAAYEYDPILIKRLRRLQVYRKRRQPATS